jgi:N-acetylglucosamine-6-phosphate deacetylase
MPSVGSARKDFVLQGRGVQVVDGVCVNKDGTLAGSDLDMAQAVRNSIHMLGLDLATAVRMASHNPAQFLGVHNLTGTIRTGLKADLVLLNGDGAVVRTWVDGQAVD